MTLRRGRPPKKNEKESDRSAPQQQDRSSPEDPGPGLRRGVARDRVLSVVDPQMRVGHKSKRQSWVESHPANEYDADTALGLIECQQESVGLLPKDLLCDGAYGSAEVERKISEVMRLHRMRQGRYFGQQKTDQQAVITVTMVNTKRLITLAAEDPEEAGKALREALAA